MTPSYCCKRDGHAFNSNSCFAQFEYVPLPWYIKSDSNLLINTNTIHDNMGSEIYDAPPQQHAITSCNTTSYKFNVGNVQAFNKVRRDFSSLTLIKMRRFKITMIKEIAKNAKTFVQTIMYNL